MNNLDALKANISQLHGVSISENSFMKALIDEGLSEIDTYTPDNEQRIDLATIRVYKKILGSPDFSEAGLSYKIGVNIRNAIESLQRKWGITPDTSPTVTGASPW